MDAIILFMIGIAIFLVGYIWRTDFEKKQHLQYQRQREKEIGNINRKTAANERREWTKGMIEDIAELEKGNYIRKKESEMSDKEKKFLEKYDKKIDKKTGKIISDIEKEQAKNDEEIKNSKWKKEFFDERLDNSNHFLHIQKKLVLF